MAKIARITQTQDALFTVNPITTEEAVFDKDGRNPSGIDQVLSAAKETASSLRDKIVSLTGLFSSMPEVTSTSLLVQDSISLAKDLEDGGFIISTTGGGLLVSSNLLTWAPCTGIPSDDPPTSVAYGQGVYILTTGRDYRLYRSTDGQVWSPVTMQSEYAGSAVHDDGYFYIVGMAPGQTSGVLNQQYRSTDGLTWETCPTHYASPEPPRELSGHRLRTIRTTASHTLQYKDPLGEWQDCTVKKLKDDYGNETRDMSVTHVASGLVRSNGAYTPLYVAFGAARTSDGARQSGVAYAVSTDGKEWSTDWIVRQTLTYRISSLAYRAGKFIRVSGSSSSMVIEHSTNGATWTAMDLDGANVRACRMGDGMLHILADKDDGVYIFGTNRF